MIEKCYVIEIVENRYILECPKGINHFPGWEIKSRIFRAPKALLEFLGKELGK